jgi:hypothetical protein
MSDIKLPKRYLIQCNTKSFFSLKEWLNKNAGKLNLDWASIIGNPEDNPALIQYIDNKIVEVLTVPQDVTVNEFTEGTINNQFPANIEITDGVGLVTPTSTVVSGNNIIITVPKPQGITFQIPIPSSIISNALNQDAGFRYANSWFDYNNNQPTKIQPELDFNHVNPHFNLKDNVSFRLVSSKKRFVDIKGGQDFTTYPDVFIDKYTGLTYRRVILSADEATSFSNTQSLSITTDGITLSDWYIASLDELLSIYGYGKLTNNTEIVDPNNSAQINVSSGIGSGVRTSSSTTGGNYLVISNLQSLTVLSVASSLTRVYLVVTKELLTEFDDYI